MMKIGCDEDMSYLIFNESFKDRLLSFKDKIKQKINDPNLKTKVKATLKDPKTKKALALGTGFLLLTKLDHNAKVNNYQKRYDSVPKSHQKDGYYLDNAGQPHYKPTYNPVSTILTSKFGVKD